MKLDNHKIENISLWKMSTTASQSMDIDRRSVKDYGLEHNNEEK